MPELNREEIIKALECCIGRREDGDCTVCPYDKHKYNCVICLMTDALTLIKQLTEENEKLVQDVTRLVQAKTEVAREIIDNISRYISLNENISKKCKEENGEQNREYFKGKLSAFLQVQGFIDIELKRQYKVVKNEA